MKCRIALVGDYSPAVLAHQAIEEVLRLAAVEGVWMHTASLSNPEAQLREFNGIWCVPASPYANTAAALDAIRYARERRVPFLGTCGGFQHALIEYARNVCGLVEADHEETAPGVAHLLISRICPLIETNDEILLAEGTLLRSIYGQPRIVEGYHCSYGLSREYESALFVEGLHPAAHDAAGEVRAVELGSHPFFVATLFQPERRALRGEMPPVAAAFVRASSVEG